jgi:hypothetical protein
MEGIKISKNILLSELELIVEHSTIVSVWIIEENNGDWYLAIDYIAKGGETTCRAILIGHLGKKRVWRKLQTVVDFWRKNVPDFNDLNIKLENKDF